ncbi:MAG: hypothetical protein IJ795_04785 [Bacteroidales bacterium]|nr:hypothetical protein [Bacteroidales bacterium]
MTVRKCFYFALSALLLTGLLSCNKGGSSRRDGSSDGRQDIPSEEPQSTFIDNPAWTITYTGRDVLYEDSGTYVVDIMHLKSTDSKTWYLDLVSANDFLLKYHNSVDSFIAASLESASQGGSVDVLQGSSDVVFDILDAGEGKWIAIAYGVDAKGNLSGEYSSLTFTTQAIELKKDNTWKMEYKGRQTIVEDGAQVDVDIINVKTSSPGSYYVYIAYPEYITEYYGGSMEAFFNGVVDEIYDGMGDKDVFADLIYYEPDLDIQFDRFRSGSWTAYAFGLDAAGNLTGSWSEASFLIEEEKPTDAFNRWLGTWEIGDARVRFPLVVSSSEANVAYVVSGWESGAAVSDDVSKYTKDFAFETRFDRATGDMYFYVQYMGYPYTYRNETYSVYLLGVYYNGGNEYVYEFLSDIACASLSEDGRKADVRGLEADGGRIKFTSMRYADLSSNADNTEALTYAKDLPSFPMTMTWVSSSTNPVSVAARKIPSRRASSLTKSSQGHSASPYRKVSKPEGRGGKRIPGKVRH